MLVPPTQILIYHTVDTLSIRLLCTICENRDICMEGGRGGIKRAINRELINNDRYVYVKSVDYKFKRAIKRLN